MEGKPLDVEIYSRGDAVRLYLDDKLIGEKPTTRAEKFKANFSVPYAPGVLKATASRAARSDRRKRFENRRQSCAIRLTADRTSFRADGQGLSFIVVEALDAKGQPHPNTDHPVTFSLKGPG